MNSLPFHRHPSPSSLWTNTTHQFGLEDPLLYDLVKREPFPASWNPLPGVNGSSKDTSPAKTTRPPSKIGRILQRAVRGCLKPVQAVPQASRSAVHWVTVTLPRGTVATIKGFRRRTLAVTAENGVIRVVVLQGSEIVSWGTTTWDPEPAEAAAEQAAPERSQPLQLQALLNDLGIQPSRVWYALAKVGIYRTRLLTDMPLYSTLMRYVPIPRVKSRYLEPVVISEVLDSIPFEKEEVDIAWHLQKGGSHYQAFAVAVPRDQVNARVKLFSDTGAFPAAAYTKASALALAAGVPDVVVLNLEQEQADIVLVHDGLPQVVHQVHPPQESSDPSAQVELLARAVEQISGYYQPLGQHDGKAPLPVMLTGEMSQGTRLVQALTPALGREVLPFAPAINFPEEFPAAEYATNVGLFLTQQGRPSGRDNVSGRHLPSLNLLPPRHMPSPLPVMPAAVFLTLLLIAIHPFNPTVYVDSRVQEAAQLTEQLNRLKAQQRDRQVILTNLKTSEDRLAAIEQQESAMQTRLESLDEELALLLARLDILTRAALPRNTQVFSLAPGGPGFTIAGTSDTYERALQYVSNLRMATEYFTDARLVRVEGTSGGGAADLEGEEGVPLEEALEELFQQTATAELGVSFQVEVFIPQGVPSGEEEDAEGAKGTKKTSK